MKPLFDPNVFPNVLQVSYFEFHGEDFLFFDEPQEYYSLYRYNRKINTFQELMYIGEVLCHLNPDLSWEKFIEMMIWVSDRSNGKSVRTYGEERVKSGCLYIFEHRKKPFVVRYRRVIFHPTRPISREEKRSIVGMVCGGSKCNEESVYEAVEELMEGDSKITIKSIANLLKVSRTTVHRHITPVIKEIIRDFNQSLLVC